MKTMSGVLGLAMCVNLIGTGSVARDEDTRRAAQRALEPFNTLVGGWRGVGQPRRMSNRGSWTEEADWAWKLSKDNASVVVQIKDGKLIESASLGFDPESKRFLLDVRTPGTETLRFTGKFEKDKELVLTHDAADGAVRRITLRLLHEDRVTLLFEFKMAGSDFFARQAEVGYTRIGGKFAAAGDGYPKCIVTGGRGTTTVTYKGKTYYVCCSGCKQAFDDDPEGVIADAAERTKAESKTNRSQ